MTEQSAPVLFVDLIKKEGKLFGLRPQRWRWVARNRNNLRQSEVGNQALRMANPF